jgi:pimeloyl-ACP methyl ester carboxylesterase
VALACGERTDAFGPSFIRADAAELPHATVEVIPGVGHFGPMQQPAVVAASLLRARDTLGGTPPS